MPILPGDELSGDCQYVGNTPVQPHKASDGTLARATEADLDAAGDDVDVIRTGMVILSSRKQAYIDAYAALGLGVCDEDDAPFAAENAPLMIRFEQLLAGVQVWLSGRDFVDYTGQASDPEYWQLAFDAVVAYAAANVQAPRTHIVVLADLSLTGGAALEINANMFADCATKPADWELRIFDDATGGAASTASYFAGTGVDALGNPSSPGETAVLIASDVYLGADINGFMATLVANAATIRAMLVAQVGLMAWSQLYLDDTLGSRGDPTVTGWSWLPAVFPGLYAVKIDTYPGPYEPTEDGESRIPGMTDSINYVPLVTTDTAQTAFAGDLNGLDVLVYTQSTDGGLEPPGAYQVEIGGVPNL